MKGKLDNRTNCDFEAEGIHLKRGTRFIVCLTVSVILWMASWPTAIGKISTYILSSLVLGLGLGLKDVIIDATRVSRGQ